MKGIKQMKKGETLEIKGLDYKLVCEQEEDTFYTYHTHYEMSEDELRKMELLIEEDKKNPSECAIYKPFEDDYPDAMPIFRDLNSYAVLKADNGSKHTYIIEKPDVPHKDEFKFDGSDEIAWLEYCGNDWKNGKDVREVTDIIFQDYDGEMFDFGFINYINSHLDKELTVYIYAYDSQSSGVHVIEGKTITTYDEYEKINEDIEYPELDDITYFILTEEGSNKAEHLYKLGYMSDED